MAAAPLHNTPTSRPLRVRHAERFLARLFGLMGRQSFVDFDALHIPRCRAVHTFGMRVAIDVIFVDARQRIVRICRVVPPRRIRCCADGCDVWELPAGAAGRLKLSEGAKWSC